MAPEIFICIRLFLHKNQASIKAYSSEYFASRYWDVQDFLNSGRSFRILEIRFCWMKAGNHESSQGAMEEHHQAIIITLHLKRKEPSAIAVEPRHPFVSKHMESSLLRPWGSVQIFGCSNHGGTLPHRGIQWVSLARNHLDDQFERKLFNFVLRIEGLYRPYSARTFSCTAGDHWGKLISWILRNAFLIISDATADNQMPVNGGDRVDYHGGTRTDSKRSDMQISPPGVACNKLYKNPDKKVGINLSDL